MSPFLQFALTLAVILLAAKMAGYASTKIGQPSVLGELVVGLILGPSLLDITHLSFITDAHLGEIIAEIGELGVLLLMFVAGFELHLSELTKNTRVSALSGLLGVVVPVLAGWGVGLAAGMPNQGAIFLGLTLGATSVSISAQTLMELKVLRSRVGLGVLGAAVFDDVLVILLLSAFLALSSSGSGWTEVLVIFLRMVVFLALSTAFGIWLLPRLMHRVGRMGISQGVLTAALVVMLAYGLLAELLGGMAAITGTFVAGLMFARMPDRSRLEGGLHALAYSFFVPIFFVSIGLSMDLRQLSGGAWGLLAAVSVTAVLSKWLGAGLGARLGGFSWHESVQLGAGMIGRGEVGLIVAALGIRQGLVDNATFSAVVAMILLTTLITPPLLRVLFKTSGPSEGQKAVQSRSQ